MGTGYKNRGSGAAGLGFKNRGAKLVDGAAYTNRGATDGVNEAFKNRGQAWGSDAYYNRGPNDFASLSVLGLAEFYAPLTHSLVLTRGTGNPTYSRATKAWEFDNEGKLILVPSDAARFGGARMVRNLAAYSEAFGNAAWALAVGASKTGNTITAPSQNDGTVQTVTFTAAIDTVFRFTAWLTGSGTVYISIQENTGTYPTSSSAALVLSGIPQPISVTRTITQASVTTIKIYIRNGQAGSTEFTGYAQFENVTGQADQTASEYVSVGVLSAPYHGAGIDGVKYFNTNKDGSAISAPSLLGYHAEGARTNSLLYSRDLTNAAWVATNITPAKTATGIDNAPNSASTLTAAAADATILQTLTMAAAARSFSAYVKRRTGTGNVYITRDGGTSWTDITSSLGASWTRVKIENTSVLNPVCGFKIATSGDAIDVDVCQDEAGAFISSPIITTTAAVTRNADALTYTSIGGWYAASGGSYLATFNNYILQDSRGVASLNDGTGNNRVDIRANKASIGTVSGTTNWDISSGGPTASGKCGLRFKANDIAFVYNSVAIGTDVTAVIPTVTQLQIGALDGAALGLLFGYTKDHYYWQTALTDAQLQQVTA